jgi:hypothetical protein
VNVHGNNIGQKEAGLEKYNDPQSTKYLAEIRAKYTIWSGDNLKLKGPFASVASTDESVVHERVKLLNEYKDFLDQKHFAEHFDSRSNLHSSVMEEFIHYLFTDLVESISKKALIGKSHSFKDIFFRPESFHEMVMTPKPFVEKKDHDFAIGAKLNVTMQVDGQPADSVIRDQWHLPALAIECKTYLDKTMLQDVSTAAEQLQHKNPNAMYIVVAEWLKLTESVNLKKYKIDQIYILRKQKNTDREFRYSDTYVKNPIYADVVFDLFQRVRNHLTADWSGSIADGLAKGILI